MRYLVNSLQAQENSYEDALNPLRNDPEKSFMGEHQLIKPATLNDIRMLGTVLMNAIQSSHHVASVMRAAPGASTTMPSGSTVIPDSGAALVHPQFLHPDISQSIGRSSTNTRCEERNQSSPKWLYVIPGLERGEWKKAIQQWHHGNPAIQLQALKDWPTHEWEGWNKKQVNSKRRVRYLIAQEYDR